MGESEVLRSLRLELGKRDDLVLWRNNVGLAWYRAGGGRPVHCARCGASIDLKETPVRYGLCVGSSDLIGVHAPTGRFVAVEAKFKTKLSSEQQRFLALVEARGGVAVEAHSSADVVRKL
jgi:hypothetical protein